MSIGTKLLDLSNEYRDTLAARALVEEVDEPLIGRDPQDIADEYEEVLKGLLK